MQLALFFVLLALLSGSTAFAQSSQWGRLRPGAYATGFRLVETWDQGRAARPAMNFRGERAPGEIAVPMQLGVWYPAVRAPGTLPMHNFDFKVLFAKKENFGPITAADSGAARLDVAGPVRSTTGDSTGFDARIAAVLAVPTAAYRNAREAAGRFPVAVVGSGGSIGNVSVLAEYLASHGWIVIATPSSDFSARMEAVAPRLAIEERVAAMAFAIATAQAMPGADISKLALIGLNFDSFPVLEYQMRYMRGLAIVTINGWQTIEERFSSLRASLWYDPARIRVPLLNFHWDESGPGLPPANLAYLEDLKYSDRRHLLVSGLDHFGLVGNPLTFPSAPEAQRVGYQYLVSAVHDFLARAAGTPGVPRILDASPADAGFPAGLLKQAWYKPALQAIPTRVEFAEVLWDAKDIAGATRLFREARAQDSTARLFTEAEMNLFAFRYQALRRFDDALAVHRLNLEATPNSFYAHNSFGNFLLVRADTAGAVREFESALSLLDASNALSPNEKTAQAQAWQAKVARIRAGPPP